MIFPQKRAENILWKGHELGHGGARGKGAFEKLEREMETGVQG